MQKSDWGGIHKFPGVHEPPPGGGLEISLPGLLPIKFSRGLSQDTRLKYYRLRKLPKRKITPEDRERAKETRGVITKSGCENTTQIILKYEYKLILKDFPVIRQYYINNIGVYFKIFIKFHTIPLLFTNIIEHTNVQIN